MPSSIVRRLAPAKINLYLHVAAPDARGYHPLQSLVVFADIGDEVELSPVSSELCDGHLKSAFAIDGPFSAGLEADESNLVMQAVRRFEMMAQIKVDRHTIRLTKNLPVASGIGGGSSDAGAVLHLLRDVYAPDMSDDTLAGIAGAIGADGVMCLWARSAVAEGYGEQLTPVSAPSLYAVLINPGAACSTPEVFRGFDKLGQFGDVAVRPDFSNIINIDQLVTALGTTRNDLQDAAIHIQPVIADILGDLNTQPETRLARMSGSGATCFALCRSEDQAQALSRRIQALWPLAWVYACRLG